MTRLSGDVLIKMEAKAGPLFGPASRIAAAGTTFELEPLFELPASTTRGPAAADALTAVWHLARPVRPAGTSHWDAVYDLARQARLNGTPVLHAEPDLVQEWPTPLPSEAIGMDADAFRGQSADGGKAVGPKTFAWHLGDDFSGLASAREDARKNATALIRIAHLDVGYGLDHATFPINRFEALLAKNCTGDGRAENDVSDEVKPGSLRSPGHGTATLCILAGARYRFPKEKFSNAGYTFDGEIGAAIDARIVGVRVGDSVVQLKTSSVAKAIAYVADLCLNEATRVHVLSMSMGGLASAAWADAVNLAYSRGVVMVTAAGNNYSAGALGGLPATSTIYPARFERVLSACGVMANHTPYFGLDRGTMQGNWGPRSKRATSLSAYTPNTPWARRADKDIVDMDGAGTSSATPQIAGAAALYLQKHGQILFSAAQYPDPWMRVEAVRQALIASAQTDFSSDTLQKLGSGVLRAHKALALAPIPKEQLKQSPEAKVFFPFLRVLTGLGAKAIEPDPLLELELAQLVQNWPGSANPFDALLAKAESPAGLSPDDQRDVLQNLRSHPKASARVRQFLGGFGAPPTAGNPPDAHAPAPVFSSPVSFEPEAPKFRELRGYALDPSFATSLATRNISETLFRIPWDEHLAPGPCDEYLEVIDVDPASNFVYEPVNLAHPNVLATRGLAPSEGTPQFHQQMVYAVARMTIENFENALGRPSLWRPGPPAAGKSSKDDSVYVPRLRIYPHALREANAYYSPAKIALLFGYFSSQRPDASDENPAERVFTCLSQDIVAHETTHALLDGMHRRYLTNSNPDVLAFHEAFADIVALFQRLTLPDLLRNQIAMTRGEIRTRRSLLGQLATQFGQATGERGGLREAIGTFDAAGNWAPMTPTGSEYNASLEPHTRGSVLVAAVFDAFISIYEKRTEDLVRIATEGTGVFRPGALHPDLVTRLAREAEKAASHVLRMCIRALDYCPPTDITFGEYLRAVITADYEIVPDDDLGYRVAFVEAFRKRGIPVCGVRTLGVESLLWRREENGKDKLSEDLCKQLRNFRAAADAHAFNPDREKIFHRQRRVRLAVHAALANHFKNNPRGAADARILGLHPALKFEVHTARFAMRVGPDGQLLSQAIIGLLQCDNSRMVGNQPFEGGSTVIADLASSTVRYIIRKNFMGEERFNDQVKYDLRLVKHRDSLTYCYGEGDEPFAALHQARGEY